MNPIELDEIDYKIIEILKDKGRIQWREIGEMIHMTGQAVGDRVRRLTKYGVISKFQAVVDPAYVEKKDIDYITMIMTSNEHGGFLSYCKSQADIKEVYKISGYGCYLLRIESQCKEDLNTILDKLVTYGNYQVSSVIGKHK